MGPFAPIVFLSPECPLTHAHLVGGHFYFKCLLFKKAFPAPLLSSSYFILWICWHRTFGLLPHGISKCLVHSDSHKCLPRGWRVGGGCGASSQRAFLEASFQLVFSHHFHQEKKGGHLICTWEGNRILLLLSELQDPCYMLSSAQPGLHICLVELFSANSVTCI